MGVEGNRAVAVGLYSGRIPAMQRALAACGYALAGRAEGGQAGLALLSALQPRLAVVGAAIPDMDGVAFARRARSQKLVV